MPTFLGNTAKPYADTFTAVDDEVPVCARITLIIEPAEHVIEFQGAGKLHRRLLMARSEVHAG